jgi:hypothetical protein
MTLTLIVGREGSGKTTFVNDVYTLMNRKCTYLRQKPVVRPYIPVSTIPDFDPTLLPFWKFYERNGTAETVKVGGTLAGKFTEGLTEGQRSLVLFELICQRANDCSDLLIALDEPFASGVHEEFVPYIIDRLSQLSKNHNIILVMNERLGAVGCLANNIITLSDSHSKLVRLNDKEDVDCEKLIHAVSMGGNYTSFKSTSALLKLFFNAEVKSNTSIWKIFFFSSLFFSLFILGLWNTDEENDPMLLVVAGTISYVCVVPYLLSLVEWRNAIQQEKDTLLQDTQGTIKSLKLVLILAIVVIVSLLEFGVLNAFIDHLSGAKFWVAILCDNLSIIPMFVCLGLYTHMSFQAVQLIGFLPFFFMVVSGTMLSPGSGVPGLKELRYLYPRFYFWCMVGSIDSMEGCPPEDNTMVYLILSTFAWPFIFLVAMGIKRMQEAIDKKKLHARRTRMFDRQLLQLQTEVFGGSSKRGRTVLSETSSDDTRSCREDRVCLLRNIANPNAEKDIEKDEEVVIFTENYSTQSGQMLDGLFEDPFVCAEDNGKCLQTDEVIESSQIAWDGKEASLETGLCHPICNPVVVADSSLRASGSSPGWSDSRNNSSSSSDGSCGQGGAGDRYEDAIRCDGDTLGDFLACSENSKSSSEYADTMNSNESSSFYDEASNTSSSLASSSPSTTISRSPKSRSRRHATIVRVEV